LRVQEKSNQRGSCRHKARKSGMHPGYFLFECGGNKKKKRSAPLKKGQSLKSTRRMEVQKTRIPAKRGEGGGISKNPPLKPTHTFDAERRKAHCKTASGSKIKTQESYIWESVDPREKQKQRGKRGMNTAKQSIPKPSRLKGGGK